MKYKHAMKTILVLGMVYGRGTGEVLGGNFVIG